MKVLIQSLLGFTLCVCSTLYAEIKLPSIISDNMVLQQKEFIHLWGEASPNETVTVSLGAHKETTLSNAKGQWKFHLKPIKQGIYTLHFQSAINHQPLSNITVNNVAVGEVWLASGQSNMEWPVKKTTTAAHDEAQANAPNIRLFQVIKNTARLPQNTLEGRWVVLSPHSVKEMSGVAYHFSKYLNDTLQVPIGIIQAAWNNTHIETWIDAHALKKQPVMSRLLKQYQHDLNLPDKQKKQNQHKIKQWENNNFAVDRSYKALPSADLTWDNTQLPITFDAMGFNKEGAIWFKRDLVLTHADVGKQSILNLGIVDDFDRVYINGQLVAETNRETPHHWLKPRHYTIPKNIFHKGKNTLMIRVFDRYANGGFMSDEQSLYLQIHQKKIRLSGDWLYHIEYGVTAKQADWANKPSPLLGLSNRNTPSFAYNAMIAPLTHYALQGVIWYQGESDVNQPEKYSVLFPLLIKQWRSAWKKELPFLFVQLANFDTKQSDVNHSTWATLRSIQQQTDDTVALTSMVTAIDIGKGDTIHPPHKRPIGIRLAKMALAKVYHSGNPYKAPHYISHQRIHLNNNQWKLIITVGNSEGLHSKSAITGFEVANTMGDYSPTKATIKQNKIVVWSSSVSNPLSIRYAWKDNPVATIYNQYNIPLKPFQLTITH